MQVNLHLDHSDGGGPAFGAAAAVWNNTPNVPTPYVVCNIRSGGDLVVLFAHDPDKLRHLASTLTNAAVELEAERKRGPQGVTS